ncbi:MAG TPA: hypothetical protein VIF82_06600 [Burkholderiaceae bacterium]|jgi:hypothetical protein
MKKVIIVVEGQTEQIFTQEFIRRLVTQQACNIILQKLHGGVLIGKRPSASSDDSDFTHEIQIINVENDEKVNTYIDDHLEVYKNKGVVAVYGLRDSFSGDKRKRKVNPIKIDEYCAAETIKRGMTINIIVAEVEIEAWFLSVPQFFEKYHTELTLEKVNEILNINLANTSVESLAHPSKMIHKVLSSVALKYEKRKSDSYKISNLLDYEDLYLTKKDQVLALNRFVLVLDEALS